MFKAKIENLYTEPTYPDNNIKMYPMVEGLPTKYDESVHNDLSTVFSLEEEYIKTCQGYHWHDSNQHAPTYRRFGANSKIIVEFGLAAGCSARGLLSARPEKFISVDVRKADGNDTKRIRKICHDSGIEFEFIHASSLDVEIPKSDVLHIDSKHTFTHLLGELLKHAINVNKYILIHDTELSFLRNAIDTFLESNHNWCIVEHHTYNHGLTVLKRVK